MGFNRNNYIRIKEEYNGKYLRAEENAKMRRAEVQMAIPGIKAIDRELALVGLEIMEAAMRDDMAMLEAAKEKNLSLNEKKRDALEAAGYPRDYTDIKYECEACGDTGAIDNKMCACMRRKLVEAGIKSSGMSDLIESQSFENFSLEYYKQTPETFKRMSMVYRLLLNYAEGFDTKASGNIAMFGGTGLGKTHLSSAIAKAVIERGYDVYYVGAQGMISDFEYNRFGNGSVANSDGDLEKYTSCDLLIIDDLGTEVSNQFTTSCLYNVINTRLNKKKQTIISTNLSQDEFRKRYWDRITSRVFGEYVILPFVGTDIRSQKIMK